MTGKRRLAARLSLCALAIGLLGARVFCAGVEGENFLERVEQDVPYKDMLEVMDVMKNGRFVIASVVYQGENAEDCAQTVRGLAESQVSLVEQHIWEQSHFDVEISVIWGAYNGSVDINYLIRFDPGGILEDQMRSLGDVTDKLKQECLLLINGGKARTFRLQRDEEQQSWQYEFLGGEMSLSKVDYQQPEGDGNFSVFPSQEGSVFVVFGEKPTAKGDTFGRLKRIQNEGCPKRSSDQFQQDELDIMNLCRRSAVGTPPRMGGRVLPAYTRDHAATPPQKFRRGYGGILLSENREDFPAGKNSSEGTLLPSIGRKYKGGGANLQCLSIPTDGGDIDEVYGLCFDSDDGLVQYKTGFPNLAQDEEEDEDVSDRGSSGRKKKKQKDKRPNLCYEQPKSKNSNKGKKKWKRNQPPLQFQGLGNETGICRRKITTVTEEYIPAITILQYALVAS